MNQGVAILLARMESNPEEFHNLHRKTPPYPGRWDWLLKVALTGEFTTVEEREALQRKVSSVQAESFTEAVLQELMEEKNQPVEPPYTVSASRFNLPQDFTQMSATRALAQYQASVISDTGPAPSWMGKPLI